MNSAVLNAMTEPASGASGERSVALVVTTFNHARFLADALRSILEQTRMPDEVIVIDDGSTDDPEAVVSRFSGVHFIRQFNQGLSAARNAGLAAARADYIVFLDADDLLLPRALELGLQAHRAAPGAAFVYGGHRMVDARGMQLGADRYEAISASPFRDLLRGNLVAMHGTVMFDRRILLQAGGYDPDLRRCEDYDIYLRLARTHPVASYPEAVASYRLHSGNMSGDRERMLRSVLRVLDRQSTGLIGEDGAAAREGRAIWTSYYAGVAVKDAFDSLSKGRLAASAASFRTGFRLSPRITSREVQGRLRNWARDTLPASLKQRIRRLRQQGEVSIGNWSMGDFGRGRPASQDFGWDRGQPVDRYYVEAFLERCRHDIAGRVLEVGDDAYCRRFGGERISRQDILHVHAGNPLATLVGDISRLGVLPVGVFDCLVLTQTLHLVYDLPAAIRNIHRSLRPGGVVLVTVPGISQIDRGEWGEDWYWSIMPPAARRLFGEVFGPANVEVDAKGNFYAAASFLAGLSQAEIELGRLEAADPAYPLIVTVRARKDAA